jgi:hypothetical protein
LAALAAGPATLHAQVATSDSAFFVSTTQRLLNAITSGDSTVWSPHLAPAWFLTTEEGDHLTRADFLASLRGLPTGQQGKLTLNNVHLVGNAAAAVVSYDADEEHNYYGQVLLTRFHSTDTWVRQAGRWQEIASQTTALPRQIDGKPLPDSLAKDYAGTYRITPELVMTVVVSDSGISMLRDKQIRRLYALDDHVFIRHGIRGFWVFERDASGKVKQAVNWRDNNPVVWTRVRE